MKIFQIALSVVGLIIAVYLTYSNWELLSKGGAAGYLFAGCSIAFFLIVISLKTWLK